MWAHLGEFQCQFESDELSRTSAGNTDVGGIVRLLTERWALGLDEAPRTDLTVVVSSTTIAADFQIIKPYFKGQNNNDDDDTTIYKSP